MTDERQQTTSFSESLSVKLKLGIIGLEQGSVALRRSASSLSLQHGGQHHERGRCAAYVEGLDGISGLTAFVTGDAYITSGIDKLIQVDNIDLSFPGYEDASNDTPVEYSQFCAQMTAEDISSRCGAINGGGSGLPGSPPPRVRSMPAPKGSFTLRLCHAAAVPPLPSAGPCIAGPCVSPAAKSPEPRRQPSPEPPRRSPEAAGRTPPEPTARGIQLTAHRPIRPGSYT